jgi:hypothetical protein
MESTVSIDWIHEVGNLDAFNLSKDQMVPRPGTFRVAVGRCLDDSDLIWKEVSYYFRSQHLYRRCMTLLSYLVIAQGPLM